MFDHILLEQEQKNLLITLVEAARNVQRRQEFRMSKVSHPAVPYNAIIHHEGLKRNTPFPVHRPDIEILGREGMLAISKTISNRGVEGHTFDINPLGFQYYKYLKQQLGQAIERIEASVHSFLDAEIFQQKYPLAYQKWTEAEKLLWSSDSAQQLTTVGHLCREAIQEFATALVDRYQPPNVIQDKTKNIARLKAVFAIQGERLGATINALLDALLVYYGTISDLIQRQEHGAQKEGQALVWEDGRRVVFNTAVVMFEIDRSLS